MTTTTMMMMMMMMMMRRIMINDDDDDDDNDGYYLYYFTLGTGYECPILRLPIVDRVLKVKAIPQSMLDPF